MRIRTARSRRWSSQKAHDASHLLPSLNAVGITVLLSMPSRIGPSSLCSTTRASATASWKSPNCLRQTLTASWSAPPSRKKAAAYSDELFRCHHISKVRTGRTEAPFTQESICVFQSSCPPPRLGKVIGQKLEHECLLFMPCGLPPETVHKLDFPERKIIQRTRRRIPVITRHEFVPGNDLHVRFLQPD